VTRIMGDAIGVNAAALAAAGTDLAAGYVTGDGSIPWTAADWALFDGRTVVAIDQGAHGSPVATASVRDVEHGAWTAAAAADTTGWTTPRPTIYISLDSLPSLEQAGWRGDVWIADYTGTEPSAPPLMPPGMTCIGVQYTDTGGGGAYDLSVIFDPTWPEACMTIPGIPGTWLALPVAFTSSNGTAFYIGYGTDGTVWSAKFTAGAWTLTQL
jgi:hypothetical protein